ncbi:DUF2225 domain-containing protein [Clostridium senegalense]|uniref:DUF2225 domain-containing protein n=1 Tax=Clostridium senegalense TaxID=1465809 RepID=UPI000287CCA7|nr:DUF2225 domain-containing protein [Clostridium senegalense]
MNSIFSGLENVGFKDTDNLTLYRKEELQELETQHKNFSLLYKKTIICPVCENTFKQLALKSNSYRMISKDSDFFIRYDLINPYFYDVYVCEHCGYSALKVDFNKITERQKELVKTNISQKFKSRTYPETYTREIAIERYKLALLNATYINSKAGTKAMICLKLAWMYRLGTSDKDKELERTFLTSALEGFEFAFSKESLPIYKMNKFILMYLIGEINRRLGNYNASLNWFSRVLTTPGVSSTLKDLTRTQRDLIKESQMLEEKIKNKDIIESNIDLDNGIDSNKSQVSITKIKSPNKGILAKILKK